MNLQHCMLYSIYPLNIQNFVLMSLCKTIWVIKYGSVHQNKKIHTYWPSMSLCHFIGSVTSEISYIPHNYPLFHPVQYMNPLQMLYDKPIHLLYSIAETIYRLYSPHNRTTGCSHIQCYMLHGLAPPPHVKSDPKFQIVLHILFKQCFSFCHWGLIKVSHIQWDLDYLNL